MRKLVAPIVALAIMIGFPDLAASTPAGDGGAPRAVDLRPCPHVDGAECGSIDVPLDPRDLSLGTTDVGFLRYPRRRQDLPSLGTIVAVEGGPGYSTIASRWYYHDLYEPLLDRRELLLVDLRGTGRSDAIDCPALQSYRGAWKRLVALCGRQLGALSERYGSAFAAADLIAVLGALEIDRIDIYGDSYGTFFAQTFAVRYPERTRTVTLDGAYPIDNEDAWWRDTNRAIAAAFRVTCERDRICAATGDDPMATIARLARRVSDHPIVGTGYNADGRVRSVRITVDQVISLVTSAATTPTIYREMATAARAAMRARHPDPAPLIRLAAENEYVGGAGDIHTYSEGLATATGCNDYPQLWDLAASMTDRVSQYRAALDALRRDDPEAARSRRTASARRCSGCATSAGSPTSPWAGCSAGIARRGASARPSRCRETGFPLRGCESAGTPGIRWVVRWSSGPSADTQCACGFPPPSRPSRRTSRRPRPASDRAPPAAARAPGRGRCVLATSGGRPARLPRTPPARSGPGDRAARGRDIRCRRAPGSTPAGASRGGASTAPRPGTHRAHPCRPAVPAPGRRSAERSPREGTEGSTMTMR